VNDDLFEEYRISGPRDQKSATTFIEWFDSVEDDFEEIVENEPHSYSYMYDEVDWDQCSLGEFFGFDEEQFVAILQRREERWMQESRDVVMAWLAEIDDDYDYNPLDDWQLVWLESGTYKIVGCY